VGFEDLFYFILLNFLRIYLIVLNVQYKCIFLAYTKKYDDNTSKFCNEIIIKNPAHHLGYGIVSINYKSPTGLSTRLGSLPPN
jgi:hypothetical protein